MADKYFIHPVGEDSNQSIVRYPSLAQTMPEARAECYVGKTKIKRAGYEVDKEAYDFFKASPSLSFLAFIIKKGSGKRQYFRSHNVNIKRNPDPALAYILKLIRNLPKEEIPTEEEETLHS